MTPEQLDALTDLLHEMMRHCYYHDGDDKKIALMERWRTFYDLISQPSEATHG